MEPMVNQNNVYLQAPTDRAGTSNERWVSDIRCVVCGVASVLQSGSRREFKICESHSCESRDCRDGMRSIDVRGCVDLAK